MFGRIGTDRRRQLVGYEMSVVVHCLHSPGHIRQIVKDEQIGNQVVVFDEFSLLITNVFAMTLSPPKETHCTNLLNRSLLVVAVWITCRSSKSEMYRSKNKVRTTRPSSRKAK
jgi:hypothetical protein